jgi:homoserine O-succinyltransferase
MPFDGTDIHCGLRALFPSLGLVFSHIFMPIILPDLPIADRIAAEGISVIPEVEFLRREGISVIPQQTAERQDIRPLEIAVLNLMPHKQRTEKQLARLLGHTLMQVHMTLLRTDSHESANESTDHLERFYKTWEDVRGRQFDGLIVTGAPVEHLNFAEVHYWEELNEIMTWARTNVCSRLSICWGAQAALHHAHGIEKQPLHRKAFGVFTHQAENWQHPLVEGFDDQFSVPVSRNTEILRTDIEQVKELDILASSQETGLYLLQNINQRDTYMFNHPEYGAKTLRKEYERDVTAGKRDPRDVPLNYFPNNDPSLCPKNNWRANGRLFYANWLNQMYRLTTSDIRDIPTLSNDRSSHDRV